MWAAWEKTGIQGPESGLFEVEKPLSTLGIGVDKLPENVRNSDVLTGNDLGMLGNVESLPEMKDIAAYKREKLKMLIENCETEALQ